MGYSGGVGQDPSYSDMKDHTESVLVEFDQTTITYEQILDKWKSLAAPYPTERQYRTAVFYLNQGQQISAFRCCADMEHVDVEPATKFFMAEDRHQNFFDRIG